MTASDNNLMRWAEEYYEVLDSKAEMTEYGERVFVGKMTDAFKLLDVGIGNYTPVRRILLASGAILMHQRGNRMQDSIVELRGAEKISAQPLTQARRDARLQAVEIQRRLTALEKWRETTGGINLGEALRSMELRLTRLEELATNGRNEVSPQNERK